MYSGNLAGKNLSRRNHDHKVYPYLLRNLSIDTADQVWATDMSYIRVKESFACPVVIMDWHSRRILAWELSAICDCWFCICALKEAMREYGRQQIFNSDQGSRFRSPDFTDVLEVADIKISMNGKERCIDNIFVERFFRTLKYTDVYLREYRDLPEARKSTGGFIQR